MQNTHTYTSLPKFSWYHSRMVLYMCMTPDLRDLKPHTLRPQRCQKTPQSSFKNFSIYSLSLPLSPLVPCLTVLVNRSLSDMQEGSQRCQHLQCLDRPLKPDPRKHTHTLHTQHALSGSTHDGTACQPQSVWESIPVKIKPLL